MGASLPLIIKEVFAAAPGGAPNPLLYAPWAAAVATLMRPLGGWLADKFGAGLITTISIATMAVGGFSLSAFLQPDSFAGFFAVVLVICAASGLGNGSVFKIIPLVLPKEAGAAIGIVSCLGALGWLRSTTPARMDDGSPLAAPPGLTPAMALICSAVPG